MGAGAADVARLAVRLTTEAAGADDGASVEWDGAWALVYGRRVVTAPDEVSPPGAALPLTVGREGAVLRVSWQAEPASVAYRLREGALGDWAGGLADPAAGRGGCTDALTLLVPAAAGDAFFLVSGVNADGVEGPLGAASTGVARAAAGATCP